MLTQAEIAVYRRNLENLYTVAEVDSRALLTAVSGLPVPVAAGQLRDVLPVVAEQYGSAATIVAGEFFLEQQAKTGAQSIRYADPLYDANEIVQNGIGYGTAQLTKGSSFEAVAAVLAGTIQRAVAGYARETVYQNADSAGVRYRRIARANACAFCAYFSVEEIETKSSRKFHNDCHCVVVPEFEDIERPDYFDDMSDQVGAGVAQVRRDREVAEAAWRRANPGGKRRQFFATEEGARVTLTTDNYLREIRRLTGRR